MCHKCNNINDIFSCHIALKSFTIICVSQTIHKYLIYQEQRKSKEFVISQKTYHSLSEKGYSAFENAEEKDQGEEQESRGQTTLL